MSCYVSAVLRVQLLIRVEVRRFVLVVLGFRKRKDFVSILLFVRLISLLPYTMWKCREGKGTTINFT